jgi:hypothetical protein
MIRKATGSTDVPFDSKPGSIVGPDTDVVAVLPATRVIEAEAEVERVKDGYLKNDARWEAEAASLREALEEIVRADDAKWRSRGAPLQSFALTEAVARARAVLDRTEQERPA